MTRLLFILALLLPVASQAGETLVLTESKVIDLALSGNPAILKANEDVKKAQASLSIAKSVYDPIVGVRFDYIDDESEKAVSVFGDDNETTQVGTGISGLLPTGTRVGVDFVHKKEETNSVFTTNPLLFESGLTVSVSQPILNDFFGMQQRGQVKQAVKTKEMEVHFSRHAVESSLFRILALYWGWVAELKNAEITQESYASSAGFVAVTGEKKKLGLALEPDVFGASANSLLMKTSLEETRLMARKQEEELKRALSLKGDIKLKAGEKVGKGAVSGKKDDWLKKAFENRSDYKGIRKYAEATGIALAIAKNQMWPQLDLNASLTLNGVNGESGPSATEAFEGDHEKIVVGVSLNYPLTNALSRANKKKARAEKTKALLDIKDKEGEIVEQVTNAYDTYVTAAKEYRDDLTIESLQRQKWEAEKTRFENGQSTSDIVIRFQEDYLSARRGSLRSLYKNRLAAIQLKYVSGVLMEP